MKVRAQFALVFNLDKCIGCHTCSVTCKNIWSNRKGVEYAWFNNVESKPGIGYPKQWENQEVWRGGWELMNGKLQLKSGSKLWRLLNIFANPDMPEIDDYYEPSPSTTRTCRMHHCPRRHRPRGRSRRSPVRKWTRSNGGPTGKMTWLASTTSAPGT